VSSPPQGVRGEGVAGPSGAPGRGFVAPFRDLMPLIKKRAAEPILFFLASPCLKASRLVFCLRAAKLHALYSLDGIGPSVGGHRVIAKLIKNPPSGFPARVILTIGLRSDRLLREAMVSKEEEPLR
jgi:hypothetical protein